MQNKRASSKFRPPPRSRHSLQADLTQPVIDKSAAYVTLPKTFPANSLFFENVGQ